MRKEKIQAKILTGGQSGLWKGLNMALKKETEQIPSVIRCADKTVTGSSEKTTAFAVFFSAKTRSIVEQNVVQDVQGDDVKVIYATKFNFITLQKTQDIMKNMRQKNCHGLHKIPL